MKKVHILLMIFLINSSLVQSQKIITGLVKGTSSEPLSGVYICQGKGANCAISDINGVFHLSLKDKYDNVLNFNYIGYKSVNLGSVDTIQKNLVITMEIDITNLDYPNSNSYRIDPSLKGWGFTGLFQFDMIKNDFGQFLTQLGDYNIDLMNKAHAIEGWELAATYNRYQAGLIYGLTYSDNYNHDSLDIEFNTTQFGLSLGYKIIDNKRLVLTPKIALKWYRFRLINSDKDKRITLNQYLTERDLDIRFNQTTGFIGTSLSYKIYKYNYLIASDYWTIGFYGGYILKLNDYPWIYSHRNRLKSENKIDMSNFNFGLAISFNID